MLRIIRGSQQNSLNEALFSCIKQELDAGESVVLVVPAQATLSSEQKAFESLKTEGFFNLHIIGGQKLHENILNGSSRPSETPVNTIGRSMLLRKLTQDAKEELKSFSSVLKEPGFIDLAGDFIVQLKQNNIDDEKLSELIAGCRKGSLLQNKLSDMRLLCNAYQAAMAGRFTDSEDLLAFVTERVKDSAFIKDSHIYFHGFYSFTERELIYLSELSRCSRGLCLTLLGGEGEEFAVTRRTERRLLNRLGGEVIELQPAAGAEPDTREIRAVSCASPYTQAQTIAADIRRLLREKGFSYGDFAVLCDGAGSSVNILKRVLSAASIPVFTDEKKSILHSSAVEAVSSAMDCAALGFRSSDIIRFCKSGILQLSQTDAEDFENYLKLYHIKGDKLHKPFKYGKDKLGEETFGRLEALRVAVSEKLLGFSERFNAAGIVRDKALVLYKYMDEELKLWEYLEAQAARQTEAGFLDAAEESTQLWEALTGLLEQTVELLGSEEMDAEEFVRLLQSAFADIKIGVLPQAEGRVQLGSVARSFTDGVKALYIAGFNRGKIPSEPNADGILTEDEQAMLEKSGVTISKSSDLLYEEECYMLRKAMDGASDYLWLGYCVSDEGGKDAKISPVLSDYCKARAIAIEEDISSGNGDLLPFEGVAWAMPHLAEQLRAAMNGAELSELWKEAYNILKDESELLRAGLRYSNAAPSLGKEKARELFAGGGEYSLSPSRMDGFAACPFRHYVNYGLRPQTLSEFGIRGSEIGSFHHEALLLLCNALSEPSRSGGFAITAPESLWMTVDDKTLEKMLEEAMLKAAESESLDGVMASSAEALYRSERVKKVCLSFAKHMVDQVRHSVIDEMYFEASFGRRGLFPPIELMTSGGRVFVEGKIDRVDVSPKKEGGKQVRIVDYKSGSDKFNKALIEQGLKLQLMTYLEGALGDFPKETPGSIYYFNIKDPAVEADGEEFSAEAIAATLAERIAKEYKLDGMDVDEKFKAQFVNTLSGLCERLATGEIAAEPKKYKSVYDSCNYCEYSGICQKDIR